MNTAVKQLVFVSLECWDEVWRRNQFVCRELAQRGWEILFVEPAADWSAGLRLRDWSQFERRPVWSPEGLPNIKVIRPVKFLPRSIVGTDPINHKMVKNCLSRFVDADSASKTVLWINNQEIWPLAKRYPWKRVIYDITDDWTRGFPPGRTRNKIMADDKALCQLANDVIVCSERLFELKHSQCASVSLIPNGVDIDTYKKVGATRPPKITKDWQPPVLGYTGTLHGARLDVEMLSSIADAWDGTIALVGPDHLGKDSIKLDRSDNIVRTGPVPHHDLAAWMSAMDVMIVPHRITAFTESLNPLKLWEYLASGLPIVSTPVAGFRDFPDCVRLADGHHDFVNRCLDAVSEGMERCHTRRQVASQHSWSQRVDVIDALLINACERASASPSA